MTEATTTTGLAAPWAQLADEEASLADFGQERLDGKVAYLATLNVDGKPRVSPVTPIIGRGHLFIFVSPDSSKSRDLLRCKEYSLHCAVSDGTGSSGEFHIAGLASQVTDPELRELAESVSSFRPSVSYLLFDLCLTEAMSTWYRGGRPVRRRWQIND